MNTLPPYAEHIDYYKDCIAHINSVIDFPGYLQRNGYQLIAKSAGSMEFKKDGERLVLNTQRNPMSYFNRHDSLDKGRFFSYLRKRSETFYKAISQGMDLSGEYLHLPPVTQPKTLPKTKTTDLSNRYRMVPLKNAEYLTKDRCISEATLQDPVFKDRIFNAMYELKRGGTIANMAFPKLDEYGTIQNYVLYNRPYKAKPNKPPQKFQVVLNSKDHYLFHSQIPKEKTIHIVFGESAIDLLSYHELNGTHQNWYISFGGQVYPKKIHSFIKLLDGQQHRKSMQLISIMDHDLQGARFDLDIFSSLINHGQNKVHIENTYEKHRWTIHIRYSDKNLTQQQSHFGVVIKALKAHEMSDVCIQLKDRIIITLEVKDPRTNTLPPNRLELLRSLTLTLTKLYIKIPVNIHKSHHKDWNEDLKHTKQPRYELVPWNRDSQLKTGDRVHLKMATGPEGTTHPGTVIKVMEKGVLCDFGLKTPYAIPFVQVRALERPIPNEQTSLSKAVGETSKRNTPNLDL
ncbi:toprim domain-containing protein [Maribacter flavus]|uniref:DUF3991 domain-containing protein n=1 Tax=Maribacter flavus TaxID=1658664 RepID=A0A5B2TPM0_9FLAO|nr:DUF3991 domain-containing protein [Maribacter flavus]KAA2215778.1 DUF3991 domain-containing protein [Maribacter flavus]